MLSQDNIKNPNGFGGRLGLSAPPDALAAIRGRVLLARGRERERGGLAEGKGKELGRKRRGRGGLGDCVLFG